MWTYFILGVYLQLDFQPQNVTYHVTLGQNRLNPQVCVCVCVFFFPSLLETKYLQLLLFLFPFLWNVFESCRKQPKHDNVINFFLLFDPNNPSTWPAFQLNSRKQFDQFATHLQLYTPCFPSINTCILDTYFLIASTKPIPF